MKCACGEEATKLAEYTAPGRPQVKRPVCDSPACQPKEKTGWTLYPAQVGR